MCLVKVEGQVQVVEGGGRAVGGRMVGSRVTIKLTQDWRAPLTDLGCYLPEP